MEFLSLQKSLLAHACSVYKNTRPLSDRVQKAFLAVPRHRFVHRFRGYKDDCWFELNEENAPSLLPIIYQDSPLIIWGSTGDFHSQKGEKPVSTISQPSFVMRMLDMLDLKEGQDVFELGTASGWNASLIATLVGPKGSVVSVEIIDQLAKAAEERCHRLGFDNVTVISGDGFDLPLGRKFDRVIFTAGAFDFPKTLFEQTKIGALSLFVLKTQTDVDVLYLLKRHQNYFESLDAVPCGFVAVTGLAHRPDKIESWTASDMPSSKKLNLRIYPSDAPADALRSASSQAWISKRDQATFVWTLKAPLN